jgi:hypothetical protein
MTDLRRTVRCSNCGCESSVSINSDLDLRELIVSGKCSRCGSAMQVSYNVIETQQSSEPMQAPEETSVNLDDTLFNSDIPSDTLRDIMED